MNRLGDETSLYLRQHAENPVDWYPWGAEALAAARETNRPILLSVGYSACHWCHVMAHESFEDPATAAVMNELFVNIKVDREERPDVDAIYMEAVQALTGRGGWPMTVFLTPDGEPFFGGTYFPKDARGSGQLTFIELMQRVRRAWDDQRDEVVEQAERLTATISRSSAMPASDAVPGIDVFDAAEADLRTSFDSEWGGFGEPPKFPQTMSHEFLLRQYVRGGNDKTLDMVTTSLDAMASGGIYDHLAGGFARYSTDRQWIVPHFEKMLYDNALLARLYLHAWQVAGNETYLQVADETISYVLDDLRDPDGGFYSAEDADSEGTEGRFYVWTLDQIESVLGDDTAELRSWFDVSEAGNFEGKNILWRPVRGDLRRPAGVELSRQRLRSSRDMRIRPARDEKVLTEWNGLMLSTLAEAALVTSNQRWLEAATRNADFLLQRLRRADGRWLRSWHRAAEGVGDGSGGTAQHLAYAADLAAVIDGLTRVGEASGQRRWIDEATAAADQLLDLFSDADNGGFYATGSDADPLITRPKPITDGPVPSANAAAAVALFRLGALTGTRAYTDAAAATLRWLGDVIGHHPTATSHSLYALELHHEPVTEIVIPGEVDDLLDVVRRQFLPNAVLAWGEPYDSALWDGRRVGEAYLCQGFTCALPATDPDALAAQLRDAAPTPS